MGTNPHVPATTSCCGRHIQGIDIEHAMSCNRLSESRSRRHDHWKEALSRISARAGCSACTEPRYASAGVAAAGRRGARADIEVALSSPHGGARVTSLLDVSMIHRRFPTHVAAASQTRGTAAALRDRSKCQAHAGHRHLGHTFVPVGVETYGHLGKHIMRYLRTLNDISSPRSRAVTRGWLLASAHRELSVALVQSQRFVFRSCVLLLAKASGLQVLPGADTPFLD
jgi:hypothetical protein